LSRVLLEKLTGFQLVKKFPSFYGTRMFITAVTSARHHAPILSQLDAVHAPTSHFLKIHINIILSATDNIKAGLQEVGFGSLCEWFVT
jgi:hypothetical protein